MSLMCMCTLCCLCPCGPSGHELLNIIASGGNQSFHAGNNGHYSVISLVIQGIFGASLTSQCIEHRVYISVNFNIAKSMFL